MWARRCTAWLPFRHDPLSSCAGALADSLQLLTLPGSTSAFGQGHTLFRAAPGQSLSMTMVLGPSYIHPTVVSSIGVLCSELLEGWQNFCRIRILGRCPLTSGAHPPHPPPVFFLQVLLFSKSFGFLTSPPSLQENPICNGSA